MTDSGRLVALGIVRRPHGVRGEVRVRTHNPGSSLLLRCARVWVRRQSGGEAEGPLEVRGARAGPPERGGTQVVLMALAGYEGRDAAKTLGGAELCVPRSELPDAEPEADEEDAHYVVDLVGLQARTVEGEEAGEVVDVLAYPSVDCLRVRGTEGDREVPMVDPWVQSIDPEGGVVVVDRLDEVPVQPGGRGSRGGRGAKGAG